MSTRVCPVCGRESVRPPYSDGCCSDAHFIVNYWLERVRIKETGDVAPNGDLSVRVDGKQYFVAPDLQQGQDNRQAGYGGQRFVIHFVAGPLAETFAGLVVVTCNLWYNGSIPEMFRDQLPDNAIFLPLVDRRNSN